MFFLPFLLSINLDRINLVSNVAVNVSNTVLYRQTIGPFLQVDLPSPPIRNLFFLLHPLTFFLSSQKPHELASSGLYTFPREWGLVAASGGGSGGVEGSNYSLMLGNSTVMQ